MQQAFWWGKPPTYLIRMPLRSTEYEQRVYNRDGSIPVYPHFGAAVIPLCSSSHTRRAFRLHPPLDVMSRAAGPFTPRRTHAVTHHELWYRYVPESGDWHGGNLTRWMAALSAAPLSLIFPNHYLYFKGWYLTESFMKGM